MRIFLHQEDQAEPEVIEVEPGVPLSGLLNQPAADLVFFRVGDEKAIKGDVTLEKAKVSDGDHLFAGKNEKLTVAVQFNGEIREDQFPSAVQVRRIFQWATSNKGFDLDKLDAAEHLLALAIDNSQPHSDKVIGSLRQDQPGHRTFNLIPKQRFEG